MILIDGRSLSCTQLHAIAHGAQVALCPAAAERMTANAASAPPGQSILEEKRHWLVGGFADEMSGDALAKTFILGHCAGVGEPLTVPIVRATMAARANVLAGAQTGCRAAAAEVLIAMLNAGNHPVVPSQGSVGAAGDLAPLAHIARVACGYAGPQPGIPVYTPTAKEALALINGISLTVALGALATVRARRLLDSAVAACAMTMEVMGTDSGCIDERLVGARNHAGGIAVAAQLRGWLLDSTQVCPGQPVDAFSIRAAPAVLGTVAQTIDDAEQAVSAELNGAGDNPLLIDGEWLEGGNFHGAPVAQVLDALKISVTHLATSSERRTFRLTHGQLSRGLPSFLVRGTGLNSGFMLAQYTAASLASECKGLAHPASVDTIPTVQHHEDHVSMGPIAGRMLLEIIECAADIVGIEVLLAAQGLDLRVRGLGHDAEGRPKDVPPVDLAKGISQLHGTVREVIDFWDDDGILHPALKAAGGLIRSGKFLDRDTPW